MCGGRLPGPLSPGDQGHSLPGALENRPFLRNLWRAGKPGRCRGPAWHPGVRCLPPHSPGTPGTGAFPPGRVVALIGPGDGQVGREERGVCAPHDGAVFGAPRELSGPVCGLQMGNANYRPRTGAPSAPNSSGLTESRAWTRRTQCPSQAAGRSPASQGPARHLVTTSLRRRARHGPCVLVKRELQRRG